jgi:hypothetical protein
MTEASPLNLLSAANVMHFMHWVNENLWWGLGVHGPSCQKDVQICIAKTEKGVRTSLSGDGEDLDAEVDAEV